MNWLLTGEGEMYLPDSDVHRAEPKERTDQPYQFGKLADLYPETERYVRVFDGVIETGDTHLITTTLERIHHFSRTYFTKYHCKK